ncbi:MAG: BBP7 family outer membrane beta-barrel protein [Bradyrhizobium sp.]|uniref:BBP7 family outer membrane beta-barrel protein n=1 Tax=Bradyrhizobium sp. TaxID=376 RepID=UPI003C78ACB4
MNKANFRTRSIAAACGTALSAVIAIGAAAAADMPIKAPPPIQDSGNLFWAEIDYLGWSVKGDHPPPLVTTSPAGTPRPQAGVVGLPTTTVLFGDSSVNGAWRSGGRLQAGYWFDPQRTRGIEASFFDLQDASTGFATDSNAHPIVGRPFFNVLTMQPDVSGVGFPGAITGSVAVNESSRLLGFDTHYRQYIGTWSGQQVSALIGYRYLRSSDNLSIPEAINAVGFGAFSSINSFGATGNFHGVDLGAAGEFKRGPWMVEWRGTLALGAVFNSAAINGSTTANFGGGVTTQPGGLLALSSNIGNFSQTRFSVVPELALKASYQFAPRWRLVAGYDLLYWTEVQRAGGLIDTAVNPNLAPPAAGGGPLRPMPVFNTSSLMAQGFNLGVRYNY